MMKKDRRDNKKVLYEIIKNLRQGDTTVTRMRGE